MSVAAMQKRLEKLEAPKSLKGPLLWICCSEYEPTRWKGAHDRIWTILPGETAESFKARVEPEARAAGIVCLSGFDEVENVSA